MDQAVLDRETSLRALRFMLTSRAIDEKCKELIRSGIPVPNFHSGTGQEALSVGIALTLKPEDYLLYTYRDFGALLAKGVTLNEIACDLLLKKSGTTHGYGGIMHVVAPEKGIVGRNGVFGSRFGIAVGLAEALVYRGEQEVVVCAFGEAEGTRGPLYEGLNLACLWRLPIVFVAENNGYSISTRTQDMYAGGNMSSIWRGFPLPVTSADGNDVEAVVAATESAVTHARSGLGPVFLEFYTYRVDPHIPSDDDSTYRSRREIQAWRSKDPIPRFEARLVERGVVDERGISSVHTDVLSSVAAAFDEARGSEDPDEESILQYVYLPAEV